MSEKPRKSATQMDDELVEFTNRVLSDQSIEESGANDEELDALKAAVFQLKAVVKNPPPETTLQRIEKQLIKEWNKDRDSVGKKTSLWQKFLPGSGPRKGQQWPALVLAFIILAIFLIVAFPVNQFITSNIQATAGSTNQYQIVLFILAAFLVISLLWFGRKKP